MINAEIPELIDVRLYLRNLSDLGEHILFPQIKMINAEISELRMFKLSLCKSGRSVGDPRILDDKHRNS